MGWLRHRYRISFDRNVFARKGFLAGDDARRLRELTEALVDPHIDAIVTARGGHGLLRIIADAPWDAFQERPKWIVGFSDPTALHAEAWRVGIASIHAANVAGLGRSDDETRMEWIDALEHPDVPRTAQGKPGVKGLVEGLLVGGNLTVLTMMAAARRLVLPHGCILALEDVTETSYRVDRMLTALLVGGYFDNVAGFALGEFTDCSEGVFRVPVEHVLEERLGREKPIVYELPFGHARKNFPLLLGQNARLDGTRGTLTVGAANANQCSR
jgi:muramoyltetrapeptide carboxypeptidase